MTSRLRTLPVALAGLLMASSAASAQFAEPFEPDADAVEAFAKLLKVYRQRPALTVKSTLKIELLQGDLSAESSEVQAEFTASRGGAGIVKIKHFTCRFTDTAFYAVHDETDHSYYESEYEGSPYWELFDVFRDLPYPHIALLWGEAEETDVWMQLHPETPMIVPTEVSDTVVEGRTMQRIVLSSPNGAMRIIVDPKTVLIQSIEHEITGGTAVQPGTKKVTSYEYQYTTYDQPLPEAELAFDPGQRQRVDLLASLLPPPKPAEGPVGGEGGEVAGPASLEGKEAPTFVLATADGGAVDLQELRGKVVVLDFWATWCSPCARALPDLHKVAAWARQEQLPVEILTINVWEARNPDDDTPDARLEAARSFWTAKGFTLPIAMDYTDETAAAYGVTGIPATFILRSDGVVYAQHTGAGPDYAEGLKAEIRAALNALESDDP